MKKQVLFFINHPNRFSRLIKRYWQRLNKIARDHNISTKVFITLVLVSIVVRWGAIGLGISAVATLSGNSTLISRLLTVCVSLVVPLYVFIWGRNIRWYVYATYGGLIAFSLLGIFFGMELLAYVISIFH